MTRLPIIAAIVVVAVVAAVLLWPETDNNARELPEPAAVMVTGCAFCHGPGGNSGNPLWPSLAGLDETYITNQLLAFRDGIDGPRRTAESAQMYSVARDLSMNEIRTIAAYYAASEAKPRTTLDMETDEGRTIYFEGAKGDPATACAACHGDNADGIADLRSPALRGQWARYTVHQLTAYADGTRADPTGSMAFIARALDDEDRLAVARHLQSLQ